MNRVGASRLWDISRVLGVPMGFFFEDMDINVAQQSPRMLSSVDGGYCLEDDRPNIDEDPMKKEETLELVRAYYKIPNRVVAKNILNLIVTLSKSTAGLARVDEEQDDF